MSSSSPTRLWVQCCSPSHFSLAILCASRWRIGGASSQFSKPSDTRAAPLWASPTRKLFVCICRRPLWACSSHGYWRRLREKTSVPSSCHRPLPRWGWLAPPVWLSSARCYRRRIWHGPQSQPPSVRDDPVSLASQISELTTTGLRHIPHRLGSSLVIVVGIAGVVAVLIPVLAMYVGFRSTIRGDGRPDRAIVLSHEATTEYDSGLSRESVAVIADAPGVRHDAQGAPMVSAEVVLAAPVARKRDHSDVNVTLRGVGGQYFAMRPELKLVAGRMLRPGNQELLVGAAARSQFEGLEIGDQVRLQDGDWKVVGVFAGPPGARGVRESELLADARTVMSAYKLDSFN